MRIKDGNKVVAAARAPHEEDAVALEAEEIDPEEEAADAVIDEPEEIAEPDAEESAEE